MTILNRDIRIPQETQRYCDDIMFIHTEYDRNYNAFRGDSTHRNAITLCLLWTGELVERLSDELIQLHTTILQRAIRGTRDVVVHGCDHVDIDTVWGTLETGIIKSCDFCAAQIHLQQGQNSLSNLTIS